MNMKSPCHPQRARPRCLLFWLPVLALLLTGIPGCEPPPPPPFGPADIDLRCNPQPSPYDFDATVGTTFDESFRAYNNTSNSNLYWSFNPAPIGCGGSPPYNCNGVVITLPSPSPSLPDSEVTVRGTPTATGYFPFTIGVETTTGSLACNREYNLVIAGPVITTPGPIAFGKPPGDEQRVTVKNEGSAAVSEVDLAVSCAAGHCPFDVVPPKILNLAGKTSQDVTVSFLRAQAPLWMTDYRATLSATVPNTSHSSQVDLIGNKGEPVITRQPERLDLSPSQLTGSVTLANQEDQALPAVSLRIAQCVGGAPCPFSASPLSFDLKAKGDTGHGDAKTVQVQLAPDTCLATANLEISVPGLTGLAGTVALQGSGEGVKLCSPGSASVRECRNGQWQTETCAGERVCSSGQCVPPNCGQGVWCDRLNICVPNCDLNQCQALSSDGQRCESLCAPGWQCSGRGSCCREISPGVGQCQSFLISDPCN